jgi:hypothetical protein
MAKTETDQQELRANEPNDDDDGGGGGNGGTSGGWVVAVIGAVVAILAIASAIGIIMSTQSKPPGTTTCTTSCWGFAKLECPGDRLMGSCCCFWGCGDPGTNHPCGTNP